MVLAGGSLRDTTEANRQHAWLQASLARIAGLIQGQRDLDTVAELIMDEVIPLIGAQHGAFFLTDTGVQDMLRLTAGYGLLPTGGTPDQVLVGRSMVGQVAKTRRPIVLEEVSAGYARISSATADGLPVNVMIVPVVFEDEVLGVIEAASVWPFTQVHRDLLE